MTPKGVCPQLLSLVFLTLGDEIMQVLSFPINGRFSHDHNHHLDYYDIRGYFAMNLHNCYENTFNMNVPKPKHAVLSRESVSFPTPTGRVTLGILFRLDL